MKQSFGNAVVVTRHWRVLLSTVMSLLVIGSNWACSRDASDASQNKNFRPYTLTHRRAADVKPVLAEAIRQTDANALVTGGVDEKQILVAGSADAHQVAKKLLAALDQDAAIATNTPEFQRSVAEPVMRAYACTADQLAAKAKHLRHAFANQKGFAVAADKATSRLMVMASDAIQRQIPGLLAGNSPAVMPVDEPNPRAGAGKSVPLVHIDARTMASRLRQLLAQRLRALNVQRPGQEEYELVTKAHPSMRLIADIQRREMVIGGRGVLADQMQRLIRAFDTAGPTDSKSVRIVALRNARIAKVAKAVDAIRLGGVSGFMLGSSAPHRQSPSLGAAEPNVRGGMIAQVNYFQDAAAADTDAPPREGNAGDRPELDNELQDRQDRLRQLGVDVEVETLEDLDVIILRGRDRDVNQILSVIEEIERLSAEAEPIVEIEPLKFVGSQAMADLIEQISDDLIGGRQGRVSVTPLIKPNSLLLIGWGEAVKAIKELIVKLDQPVLPDSELKVFRLRHAPAVTASATIMSFFSGRTGLGTKVLATPEPRTNALIVRASPRDMAEVQLLIERIDTPGGDAVSQMKVFELKNSLATALAATIQRAIVAARGGPGAGGKSSVLEFLTVDERGKRAIQSGVLNDVRITADPRTNTLLVTAPEQSMRLVAELIRQLDASPSSVAQIKVFGIVHGAAADLVIMLRSLVPSAAGTAIGPQLPGAEGETSMVPLRFSVDTRTNTIIATGSMGDLAIIEALLLRLDQETTNKRRTTVYRLKNSPALDVAAAINEILRIERQVEQISPGTANPFQRSESEVIVVPEPVSNSVIISATPEYFDEIKQLVDDLDEQPAQVQIEVIIAEVDLGNVDEFGIELGLQDSLLFDRSLLGDLLTTVSTQTQSTADGVITNTNEIVQSATNTPGFGFNNQPLGNSGSTQALSKSDKIGTQGLSHFSVGRMNNELGFGGMVLSASSESVSVLIRALQASQRLEVLSRPHITTLDNQPAFIQVGEKVPRIESTTFSQFGQTNSIVLDNVGLIIGVTPRISPTGHVVMELDVEKSKLGSTQDGIPISISESGEVIKSPRIKTSTAQATINAASDQTVILGGLITKNQAEIHRRVPFLSDIPVIGQLFRYDFTEERREELLIILTPRVINGPEDQQRLLDIETQRMSWTSADVHELHGDSGLCTTPDCPYCQSDTPVIYPDLMPRGLEPVDPMTDPIDLPVLPDAAAVRYDSAAGQRSILAGPQAVIGGPLLSTEPQFVPADAVFSQSE